MTIQFNADNKSKQCFPDVPEYSVKGVKSFMGQEGLGYECTLYKDGKRIGTVTDTCDGGEMLQMYLKGDGEKALEAYCLTLPKNTFTSDGKEHSYHIDPCIFVGRLVDKFETDKRNKKNCKTKTLVEVEENGEKVVYAYKCKFSQEIKQKIKDRDYPDTDVVFVNERYL